MTSDSQPPGTAEEKLTDDRTLSVARDQRRELASLLLRHAEELTRGWQQRAASSAGFAPARWVAESGEAGEPSLLALVEHLEAAGPDTHLPAHVAWMARWHEGGSDRAAARDHFHALRDMVTDFLESTSEIAEGEKPALLGLLEAAVRNLRLETNEEETRHLLAEALEARRQFEGLFEKAVDAIIIADLRDDTVLAANPAAAALTNVTPELLPGLDLSELLPDLPRVLEEQTARDSETFGKPQLLPMNSAAGLVRTITHTQ